MAKTTILWTDYSFNPWTGCTAVSAACDNCYAEGWAKRSGHVKWGAKEPRRRTTDATWAQVLKWNAKAKKAGVKYRVFVASLSDVFDNHKSILRKWRTDLWKLISECDCLVFMLLTKRPQNIGRFLPIDWGFGGYPNVWLGVTAENQEELDRRGVAVLNHYAAGHFVSCEPLLGPLDFSTHLFLEHLAYINNRPAYCRFNLVIVGGESGPGSRPMHPDWARGIRDQCRDYDIPFAFKQWGEWTPGVNVDQQKGVVKTASWFAGEWDFNSCNLANTDGHIDDESDLYRMGKKKSGRLLDGLDHSGTIWSKGFYG